jgi:hypothetical protein
MKWSPDAFVVLHLEGELAATEAESEFQEKSARQRIRQIWISRGDVGAVSFPARAKDFLRKKATLDERPDAMDRFAAAMKQRSVDSQIASENDGIERRFQAEVVIVEKLARRG